MEELEESDTHLRQQKKESLERELRRNWIKNNNNEEAPLGLHCIVNFR